MAWKDTTEAPPAIWSWQYEIENNLTRGIQPSDRAACYKMAKIVGGLQGKTVLDLGSGRGACLRVARELGAIKLIGLDLDPYAVKLTALNVPGAITALDMPDAVDVADVVWSHGVVEHQGPEELEDYINQMVRLSRKWVAVSAPNPANPPYQAFRKWELEHETWAFGYEEPLESYGPALEAAGLKLVYDGDVRNPEIMMELFPQTHAPEFYEQWKREAALGTMPGPSTVAVGRLQ